MKRNDLVGQVFGRLQVTGVSHLCKKQNVVWSCRCVCGATATAYAYDLRAGKVISCGCYSREGSRITHGKARAGTRRSPVYSIWASMLARCENVNDRKYAGYGGRGITVCKRWHTFENFYADMGDKPKWGSIDRRDNSKGYSPVNCYWATKVEQARNTRHNVWITIGSEKVILVDALARVNKRGSSLHYQMQKNALTHQEVFDIWLQKKV